MSSDRFAYGRPDPQDKPQECTTCDGCSCVIVYGEEAVIEDGWIYHSVACYMQSHGARVGIYGDDILLVV